MTTLNYVIKPIPKQKECWRYLKDKQTRYILFGGGAGGSKSWLGCEWLIFNCLMYPDTKWFIARNELKRLYASTYITFMKVCKERKLPKELWNLKSHHSYIEFFNGSRIDLLDVAYKPSDPLYERFGSTEYTSGWLEEIGEIKEKVFDVLKSRIGRHLNDKYDLFPKLFLTCNPKKHWAYNYFYKPWKEGTLPKDCVFIQSLYNDNPFTSKSYGESLAQIKDKAMKERLMYGNWEYDDDSGALMEYEKILNIFQKDPVFLPTDKLYLSVDVARFGQDKAVIMLWHGLHIKNIWYYDKSSMDFLEEKIRSKCNQFFIPFEQVIIDQDGIGGSLVDYIKGSFAFVNGARAIEEVDDNKKFRMQETNKYSFKNLRSQCYFKLSELINENKISVTKEINPEVRNWIIQELESIRKKNVDNNESKFQIISKEEMKDVIGRSPDFSDTMMMRMYYELGNNNNEVALFW